jgi:hypothetical protein
VPFVPVLISPRKYVDGDAATYASNVCYWNLDEFRQWAAQAMSIVRKLRTTFPGEGHSEWREEAFREYRDARIDPEQMRKELEGCLLKDLEKTSPQRS